MGLARRPISVLVCKHGVVEACVGRECSKSYSGRGAHGLSLRRRCKTFPLLSVEATVDETGI